MQTAVGHTRVVLWLLAAGAGLMLATASVARAQPPITGTEVSRFSESFSDDAFLCQDELYAQTVSGHSVVHFTFSPDTGALHFHMDVHGKVVAVPLDGTGPTYTGNFWESDTESIGPSRAATCS